MLELFRKMILEYMTEFGTDDICCDESLHSKIGINCSEDTRCKDCKNRILEAYEQLVIEEYLSKNK